jgi:hypothetical protein
VAASATRPARSSTSIPFGIERSASVRRRAADEVEEITRKASAAHFA